MWEPIVGQMLQELALGGARADAYWAQQLAFGPVLVHAMRLHMRRGALSSEETAALVRALRLALAGLAALPEAPGADPRALPLVAQRQARALAWGRRRCLRRMLERLGASEQAAEVVPARHLRPYPLLGWRPGEPLAP